MFALSVLLAACSLVSGRDYRLRAMPSVSHSIVNLGKMEFNVYMNAKTAVPELPNNEYEMIHDTKPMHTIRSESAECPCQQNRLRNRNQDMHSPHDMLSKILMNDDLFSFKDTMSSPLCCSSHEQIQEEFFVEINPKTGPQSVPLRQNMPVFQHGAPMIQSIPPMPIMPIDKAYPKPMQFLPLIFDTLYPNKGPQRPKSKTLEIILFPTRKLVTTTPPTKTTEATTESDIQVVGDKKTTMVYDLIAANSSVKKDLKQEVGEHLKNMDAVIDTDKTTSAIQSNTL
ncbi:uncharacterized protein LOC133521881 isoform X1 [Cydia pomonella]|uniref:uncharacterized protein LOC133521881 isoform X1 n=1 Tax=Cydia pomonella TaxID=82600 RepID=UPI002ADE6E01|nr:uncharacterized protein LOC133521881 isoform X1 [Cydia pomonella]XP_061712973.1 uncharacterized protein LOC133521881 isoform X1 [Cydia pomonella]